MKYLITGATGFIGSHLLQRLVERGVRPYIIIRKDSDDWRIKDLRQRFNCCYADISDATSVETIVKTVKPDVVYHLATYYKAFESEQNPDRVIQSNFIGGWNLLKSSKECLFINTGSLSEYGSKVGAFKEGDILKPTTVYSVTKCAMTWLSKLNNAVTLRPFCVYGEKEPSTRLIPRLMHSFLTGERMKMVNPQVSHDFIYVDDIVDAYMDIDSLAKYRGEVFNLGTGTLTTLKELVSMMETIKGTSTDLVWGALPPRAWDTTFSPADTSKSKDILGWEAKTTLFQGLKNTWKFYKENLNLKRSL